MSEIKRVLEGKFKLLQNDKCPQVTVPKFPELTVEKAFEIFKGDTTTLKHLPLLVEGRRKPDRGFVYGVLRSAPELHAIYCY